MHCFDCFKFYLDRFTLVITIFTNIISISIILKRYVFVFNYTYLSSKTYRCCVLLLFETFLGTITQPIQIGIGCIVLWWQNVTYKSVKAMTLNNITKMWRTRDYGDYGAAAVVVIMMMVMIDDNIYQHRMCLRAHIVNNKWFNHFCFNHNMFFNYDIIFSI